MWRIAHFNSKARARVTAVNDQRRRANIHVDALHMWRGAVRTQRRARSCANQHNRHVHTIADLVQRTTCMCFIEPLCFSCRVTVPNIRRSGICRVPFTLSFAFCLRPALPVTLSPRLIRNRWLLRRVMTRVSRLIMNAWHNHAKMWFMWRAITTRRCFAGWKEEWRGSKLLDGIGFMTVRRHAVLRGLRLVRGWHLWALRCGQRRKRLLGVEGRITRRSGIRVQMMVFGSWRDLMLRSVYVKQRVTGPKGSSRLLLPRVSLRLNHHPFEQHCLKLSIAYIYMYSLCHPPPPGQSPLRDKAQDPIPTYTEPKLPHPTTAL